MHVTFAQNILPNYTTVLHQTYISCTVCLLQPSCIILYSSQYIVLTLSRMDHLLCNRCGSRGSEMQNALILYATQEIITYTVWSYVHLVYNPYRVNIFLSLFVWCFNCTIKTVRLYSCMGSLTHLQAPKSTPTKQL